MLGKLQADLTEVLFSISRRKMGQQQSTLQSLTISPDMIILLNTCLMTPSLEGQSTHQAGTVHRNNR